MQRDPATSPFGILGRALGTGPLGGLKRYLRWFNLTMLQQALWPLLIAVASAPQVDLENTPPGWFVLRLAGPALAVVISLLYLRLFFPRQSVASPFMATAARGTPYVTSGANSVIPSEVEGEGVSQLAAAVEIAPNATSSLSAFFHALITPPPNQRLPAVATQLRYALLALPIVIAILRLVVGPVDEATKIILFGLVNVAAYHLIHFGVVPRSFDYRRQGLLAGALLFGLSWGLNNSLMVGLNDGDWLLGLAAGCVLGWLFGFGSLAIRQWPGGALAAAAAHFLVVYLVAGFI